MNNHLLAEDVTKCLAELIGKGIRPLKGGGHVRPGQSQVRAT